VRVRGVQPLAEDTLLLHLQTPRTNRLRFLAGQSVTLFGGAGGIDAQHAYPIASCPCDDRNLHFHIARDPADALAELLHGGAFRAGDSLTLWGPSGEFVLAQSERPLTFVACATGFAPIKSLIEHAMAVEATESISLDWLALRPGGHYLANQCRAWAAAFDDFRYAAHTASDPAAGARALVADLAAAVQLPARDVYVAGPGAFVDAAVPALHAAGAAAAHVFASIV
jgi:CDP-4-dehydro-6-deoxyglucose reductase